MDKKELAVIQIKNKKEDIKIQGQGCLDDCRIYVGKTSYPNCRTEFSPKFMPLY